MRLLVVTPMQEEHDLFAGWCADHGYESETSSTGRLPLRHFPALNLTLARGGTGKPQFALQTQHLLDALDAPDLVICAGAAGALSPDLKVGDVVVATATIEHDRREGFEDLPLPRFPGSAEAIDSLREVAQRDGMGFIHFGPVASGDEDIVDGRRREALQSETGAIAVAWEGAGGARACHFSQTPYLELRGVTDAADHNAAADFENNLAQAMSHIAALLVAWLG